MRKMPFACVSLFLFLLSVSAFCDSVPTLDQLKPLVGNWEGTFQWSGARTDSGKMDAAYSLTGHGSAVVENLMNEGEVSMTSVYHMDGNSLRVTHFCGAGNQPRFIATSSDDPHKLSFKFVDATNLATPDAPHVTGVNLSLDSADAISITFTFTAKGKTSTELIQLHRKS